ncbi:MAG: TlpA family protein disulfide reductase [Spirochaetia bacterium]|nr:TlpA family protein disulfide reductase [Spirochaetia bacterium]
MLIILLFSTSAISAGGKKEVTPEASAPVAESTTQIQKDSQDVVLAPFWSINLYGEDVSEEIFAPYDLTMVNVWGTYCRPCITEMPGLGTLSREYKEKGVQIMGIVVDVYHSDQKIFMEKLGTAMEIIAYTKADYPHILQSKELIDLYLKNVQVIPTTFFVDKNGKVLGEEYLGSQSEEDWRKIIDKMISEYVK